MTTHYPLKKELEVCLSPNPNDCPLANSHTMCYYDNYVECHKWLNKMLKTHDQVICHGCGMPRIWRKKK